MRQAERKENKFAARSDNLMPVKNHSCVHKDRILPHTACAQSLVVFDHLVGGALWWLAQLHVVLQEHEPAELLQHGLDGVLPAPPGKDGHCTDVNLENKIISVVRLEQLILHILVLRAIKML